MDITEALLDSWDRQCHIVDSIAGLIDESNKNVKPSEDGWPLYRHLAHMHKVRHFFLTNVAPDRAATIENGFGGGWETPIEDLDRIRELLKESGLAVREVVADALAKGLDPIGWYDNPVLFLQHMVWHDGWHIGLITLGLRLNGQEQPDEWDEEHVWGQWRTEVW